MAALSLALATTGLARAQAVYVVDTGPGANTGGLSLTRSQYLAGRFTLDQGHELYALEGWMIYPTITGSLPVWAVLYREGEDSLPDLSNEVYSQLFAVPASGIPFAAGWHGVHGFTLPVYGGTYWLAFEVPTTDFGSGAMPPTPSAELDDYAVDSGGGYVSNSAARIGIRVLPEPAPAKMLAWGMLGLIGLGAKLKMSDEETRSAGDFSDPC